MNIGIEYKNFEDLMWIWHPLLNEKFKFDFFEKPFFIEDSEENIYYFYNMNDTQDKLPKFSFNDCDLKIRATYLFPTEFIHSDEYKKRYHKVLFAKFGDPFPADLRSQLKKFLDDGNLCISDHFPDQDINFSHENFLYYPFLTMVFFYYYYGFYFLNYYKNTNKKNLIGAYYAPLHVNGTYRHNRTQTFNAVKNILQDDLHAYHRPRNMFLDLIDTPYRFNKWGSNHISSYTDYSSSVCNIVFETEDMNAYGFMSEKTLKSIIFCEENIFFIYAGAIGQLKHLVDAGFWFLNLEFIDKNFYHMSLTESKNILYDSVIKTVNFLKKLKAEKGTNEKVYEHLMSVHGHKLTSNVSNFKHILNNCAYKKDLINFLKK